MTAELFTRAKQTPECLSTWAIHQHVLGELPDAAHRHLAQCSSCTAKVREAEAQQQAARYERVPDALLQPLRTRPAWSFRRLVPGLLGAAVAAGLALLVVPHLDGAAPELRTKGGPQLEVAVSRAGALTAERFDLAALPKLHMGDRLRLRVTGSGVRWVVLESDEAGHWTPLHEGAPPADGWLPLGLTVTPGKTRLRWMVCSSAPLAGVRTGCREQVTALEVAVP